MGRKIVILNNEVLVDHTQTNLIPEDVRKGKIYYNPKGDLEVGTYEPTSIELTPDFCSGDYVHNAPGRESYKQITIHKPDDVMIVPDPNAELNIDSNGQYDVLNYSKVDVDIKPNLESILITPSSEEQKILPTNTDGFSEILVNAVEVEQLNITKNGSYEPSKQGSFISKVDVNIQPNIEPAKTIQPSVDEQVIEPSEGFDGLAGVTVEAIKTETLNVTANGSYTSTEPDTFITSVNVNVEGIISSLQDSKTVEFKENVSDYEIYPDEDYEGLAKVNISIAVQPSLTELTVSENNTSILPEDADGFNKVIVQIPTQESKSVTPTKSEQEIQPDPGCAYLEKVIVEPIPNDYIIPSDTLEITENKSYDVTNVKEINVNVPIPDGYMEIPTATKPITENGFTDVRDFAGVDVQVPIPEGYVLPHDKPILVSANGQYTAPEGTAFKQITVDVKSGSPVEINSPETLDAILAGTRPENIPESASVFKYTGASIDNYDNGGIYFLASKPADTLYLYKGPSTETYENGDMYLLTSDPTIYYVSLGDSIAAGENIRDEDRLKLHTGEVFKWQYGYNDAPSTEIILNTYTDLLTNQLKNIYGKDQVEALSFAVSGYTNKSLMEQLQKPDVAEAVSKADILTISIGSNSVLITALMRIQEFITGNSKQFKEINDAVDETIEQLRSGDYSFLSLLQLISQINRKHDAKIIFNTLYNPYKSLRINPTSDAENYRTGYFSPIFAAVPNIETPGWWDNITGLEVDLRKYVYEQTGMLNIAQKINNPAGDGKSLGQWVQSKLDKVNTILREAILQVNKQTGRAFELADVGAAFTNYQGNYRDIVNSRIEAGSTIVNLSWYNLWTAGSQSLINAVLKTVEYEIDPHPTEAGHKLIYNAIYEILSRQKILLEE